MTADLRMAFLVANKLPLTVDEIKQLICRVFTCSFAGDDGYETRLIENLVNALYEFKVDVENADENDDNAPTGSASTFVEGTAAEDVYNAAIKKAYLTLGFDEHYASEASGWPEILPLNVRWDPELLETLARLEVGHDLIVMDVIKNMQTANIEVRETNG